MRGKLQKIEVNKCYTKKISMHHNLYLENLMKKFQLIIWEQKY